MLKIFEETVSYDRVALASKHKTELFEHFLLYQFCELTYYYVFGRLSALSIDLYIFVCSGFQY